jgi:hypothetical protein
MYGGILIFGSYTPTYIEMFPFLPPPDAEVKRSSD